MKNMNRRGFISGLASLIVAPAIVKPFNIMSVSIIDLYNTRYLWAYEIMSNRMILRIDRALHNLPIPKSGAEQIPAYVVHKIIPKAVIDDIRPKVGEQKYFSMYVTGKELLEVGYN